MKKPKRQPHRPKGKHVLLVVRKIIGAKPKECRTKLGLAYDTIKGISCGRDTFTPHAAKTLAENTGIAFDTLLTWDGKKPLKTQTGEPFTLETYQRHRMQCREDRQATANSRKRGNESFRLYYLLCIKLGRVLLAAQEGTPAQPQGDTQFAAWALRDAINKVGNLYPGFDTNRKARPGVIEMRSAPETFDRDLQTLMSGGTKKPSDVWQSIAKRFHRDLAAIERQQAKAVASETPPGQAKRQPTPARLLPAPRQDTRRRLLTPPQSL